MTYKDIEKACEGLRVTAIERYNRKTGQKESKDYIDVSQRVKAFRKLYPQGYIKTDIISIENGACLVKATVGYYDQNGEPRDLATGTAQELQNASQINKTSYIENCETSAVGRALGMAGLGIDGGIASADEMKNALGQQEETKAKAVKTDVITETAAKKLQSAIRQAKEIDETVWPTISKRYNVTAVSQIKKTDYNAIVQQVTAIIEKKGA